MTEIQALLAQAMAHHQAGRMDQAAPLYQKVLTLDPGQSDALHLLGMLAMQTGQHEPGIRLIRRAIASNGRQAVYHFNLGLALAGMGRLDEAIASYRRALVLAPNDLETCINLGGALAALGRLDEAQAAFTKALSLQPGNPAALANLGTVFLNQGRRAEAEDHYRKALALAPDFPDALLNLGNLLLSGGDFSGAEDCYARALAVAPSHAQAANSLGLALSHQGRRTEALACFQKAVALNPDLVEALSNLALALWEEGDDLDQAEILYRRVVALAPSDPDLLNNYAAIAMARNDGHAALDAIRRSLGIRETPKGKKLFVALAVGATWASAHPEITGAMTRALLEPWDRPGRLSAAAARLVALNPAIAPMLERAERAWPARLSSRDLLGEAGFAPLAADSLLLALLVSAPNTDLVLERFLTLARAALLAGDSADQAALSFAAALAQQCFINEYVFATDSDETAKAQAKRDALTNALATEDEIAPLALVAVAAYFPLHAIAGSEKLLARAWPAAIEAILTQQLREPLAERRLAADIPRLTEIEDDVSRLVRGHYEENPYPRWVRLAPAATPDTIAGYLARRFPLAGFDRQPGRVMRDFLVAGCGTGQHPIASAQSFGSAAMLAVDLSVASLSYAARKTAEYGLAIEYAQADILELGGLTRDFDVIESIGVLHHMKEPFAGWKSLLSRLRPKGFLRLGLYSELARREIVAARLRIAEAGRGSDAGDIRAFRQELAGGKFGGDFAAVLASEDFFTVSACRDLLFHAQEHRLTIPRLARFLEENSLTFLGFEVNEAVLGAYQRRFPEDRAATDLGRWDIFEQENPDTFAALYVFWMQGA